MLTTTGMYVMLGDVPVADPTLTALLKFMMPMLGVVFTRGQLPIPVVPVGTNGGAHRLAGPPYGKDQRMADSSVTRNLYSPATEWSRTLSHRIVPPRK
jgi:hypothetical protein